MELVKYVINYKTLYEIEKIHILRVLEHFEGNKTKTANTLGITIKTLYNKLYEYGETDWLIKDRA